MRSRDARDTGALSKIAPNLEAMLLTSSEIPARFEPDEIKFQTVRIPTRDGFDLATDIYAPPLERGPTVLTRSPYGRGRLREFFIALARRGYFVVSQDCRGTGDSEPSEWDYYVFEREDSFDLVEWTAQSSWYDGFIAGCGSSYAAQTQWCMAMDSRMSAIAPEVGGLGVKGTPAKLHMFLNAYAKSVGSGRDRQPIGYDDLERQMIDETLATGYYNDPLHVTVHEALLSSHPELRNERADTIGAALWKLYCSLKPGGRAALVRDALNVPHVTISDIESLCSLVGRDVAHDAFMFAVPDAETLGSLIQAPALMITGWYDWGLTDALATWRLLQRGANEKVKSRSRLIIAPIAHNASGYRENRAGHAELDRTYRTSDILDVLLTWFSAARSGDLNLWPKVIYYLMGANSWHCASEWPPAAAKEMVLYLNECGSFSKRAPPRDSSPDQFTYDPDDPTPTVGGSIVSYVYTPGSVDVSEVQRRPDVLTFSSDPLSADLDVVGPMRLILYAGSTARDTDFFARVTDVFPDGRAIQLQSGMVRARYRDGEAKPLEPGEVYRFEIDIGETATRFLAGHRLRLDISSSDFPKFERSCNRCGESGPPIQARQTIFHDATYPSQLRLFALCL